MTYGHRPFWMAAVAYIGITGALVAAGLRVTESTFTYALDDAYIHMAVARTFAESGTWGLRPGEFAGVSSSPLWTLLLSVSYWGVGVVIWAPLVLNLASGAGAIWGVHRWLQRLGWQGEQAVWWLTAFVMVVPLPTLAVTGMEHTLQIALTLAVLQIASDDNRRWASLAATSAGLAACRYEGLFVLAPVAVWLLFRGQTKAAATVVFAAGVAVLAYAWLSTAHGWPWLPTSVLVKSGMPLEVADLPGLMTGVWNRIVAALRPRLELAFLLGALVLAPGRLAEPGTRLLVSVFVAAAMAHLALVPSGIFFRYEAVVVAMGALVMMALGRIGVGLRPLVLAVWVLVGALSVLRAIEAIARTPDASQNIYEQQFQMARFVRDHLTDKNVALNDIGAVSFFSQSRVVDLAGLATLDVAELRRRKAFDTAMIDQVTRSHDVDVALLYPEYFKGTTALPAHWIEVQRWHIENRASAAFDVVGIYAATTEAVEPLAGRLNNFTASLPATVQVTPTRAGGPATAGHR